MNKKAILIIAGLGALAYFGGKAAPVQAAAVLSQIEAGTFEPKTAAKIVSNPTQANNTLQTIVLKYPGAAAQIAQVQAAINEGRATGEDMMLFSGHLKAYIAYQADGGSLSMDDFMGTAASDEPKYAAIIADAKERQLQYEVDQIEAQFSFNPNTVQNLQAYAEGLAPSDPRRIELEARHPEWQFAGTAIEANQDILDVVTNPDYAATLQEIDEMLAGVGGNTQDAAYQQALDVAYNAAAEEAYESGGDAGVVTWTGDSGYTSFASEGDFYSWAAEEYAGDWWGY